MFKYFEGWKRGIETSSGSAGSSNFNFEEPLTGQGQISRLDQSMQQNLPTVIDASSDPFDVLPVASSPRILMLLQFSK